MAIRAPLSSHYFCSFFITDIQQLAEMLPSTRALEVLEGVETEVVLQQYADRIMVLVSQVGKVGNLVLKSHNRLAGKKSS